MVSHAIPCIIHQPLAGERHAIEPPDGNYNWKIHHPDWQYRRWSQQQARDFVAQYYPEFLSRYIQYRHQQQRDDAFRYLLLNHFGGIFAEPDVECLRPFDRLIQGRHFLIGFAPYAHAHFKGQQYLLSNALLAAAPGTPFLRQLIERMLKQDNPGQADSNGAPLLKTVFEVLGDRQISLFPPIVFSPLVANSLALKHIASGSSTGQLLREMLTQQTAFAINHHPLSGVEFAYPQCLQPAPGLPDNIAPLKTHCWTYHHDGYFFRQSCQRSNSEGLISIIAWNRPLYLEQVLESLLRADGLAPYDIHISVDYYPDTLAETLAVIDRLESQCQNRLIIELHSKNIGNTGNTRRSCDYAFIENDYDYTIHLEDDSIMGKDCILWSEWAYQQTHRDPDCFCICPFIPQNARLEEKLICLDYEKSLRRNFFEAQGGFTLSRAQYAYINELGGIFGALHQDNDQGSDWHSPEEWKEQCLINDMQPFDEPWRYYFLRGKYTLSPYVSRAQNIGEEDGAWNPNKAWHNQHIRNACWIDSVEFDQIDKACIQYQMQAPGAIKDSY